MSIRAMRWTPDEPLVEPEPWDDLPSEDQLLAPNLPSEHDTSWAELFGVEDE